MNFVDVVERDGVIIYAGRGVCDLKPGDKTFYLDIPVIPANILTDYQVSPDGSHLVEREVPLEAWEVIPGTEGRRQAALRRMEKLLSERAALLEFGWDTSKVDADIAKLKAKFA